MILLTAQQCHRFDSFEWNFRYLILQIISVIDGWGISCILALWWMSLGVTDDKSTLVQVRAWCRQATSHYLSQYWPRSLSPYGVTRTQWVDVYRTLKQGKISQLTHWQATECPLWVLERIIWSENIKSTLYWTLCVDKQSVLYLKCQLSWKCLS